LSYECIQSDIPPPRSQTARPRVDNRASSAQTTRLQNNLPPPIEKSFELTSNASSLLTIESLLGLASASKDGDGSEEQGSGSNPETLASPDAVMSVSSQASGHRSILFSEANYRRWGAACAIGQTATGVHRIRKRDLTFRWLQLIPDLRKFSIPSDFQEQTSLQNPQDPLWFSLDTLRAIIRCYCLTVIAST
jgi:hypothetical protein